MKRIAVGEWSNNPNEEEYLNALCDILAWGDVRKTRNGYTRAIFARQVRFKMEKGFPAPSTKQLAFKSVLAELIWFIEAGKDSPVPYRLSIGRLNQLMGLPEDANNPLWSHDQQGFAAAGKALFPGDCGVIYGSQWRNFNGERKDQLAEVIAALKKDPFSRYHVITAWNPLKTGDMCLPPCHMKIQFFVRHSRRKDKKLYLCIAMDQRSCDMFLGVPFNIASYALLLHMVAQCVDMIPDELIITLNDCHIYSAHLKPVRTQLARSTYKAPKLEFSPRLKNINDFHMGDVRLTSYKHQGRIKAKLL
ncbi:MAG: thymidylate synthase [bacterium]|nr:thymidylate synthase [bacterium]